MVFLGAEVLARKITLRLSWQKGEVRAAETKTPSLPLISLLKDKPFFEAPKILSLLHPLSPKTHEMAAWAAISAARGEKHLLSPHDLLAFFRESVREHGFYLFAALPEALGLLPEKPLLLAMQKTTLAKDTPDLAHDFLAFLEKEVLGAAPALFRSSGGSAPWGSFAGSLFSRLEEKVKIPWQLCLLSSWVKKRLLSLAGLPLFLEESHRPLLKSFGQEGWGIAGIRGARGIVIHQARVRENRILGYSLDTPTSRHFSSDGPWARGLLQKSFASPEEACGFAMLWARVLDPCMEFEIQTCTKQDLPRGF